MLELTSAIQDGAIVYTFDTATGFYRDANGAFLIVPAPRAPRRNWRKS